MTIDHVTVTAQAREHAARNHFTLRAKAKNVSETQKNRTGVLPPYCASNRKSQTASAPQKSRRGGDERGGVARDLQITPNRTKSSPRHDFEGSIIGEGAAKNCLKVKNYVIKNYLKTVSAPAAKDSQQATMLSIHNIMR